MFNQKILTVIIIVFVLLAILYLLGKKSVHHEIIINAPKEKVWTALVDMKQYKEWNPVMKLVQGEVEEGNKVTYEFTQDENTKSKISASVRQMKPNELLNQFGGIPFILTFDHKYILEEQGEQTKVIIHEDYRGIWVNFWNPKPVEKAYARLNEALKNRVEPLN